MPISNECIKLLRQFVDNYTQTGPEDRDYKAICPLLKEFLFTVTANKNKLTDDRVISYLSNSALVLEDSPVFLKSCRVFIISYQKLTQSLDSMLTKDLSIQEELNESWGTKQGASASQTQNSSVFFIELQKELAKRAQRMAEQKGIEPETFNKTNKYLPG